jgi:hypothetical protein
MVETPEEPGAPASTVLAALDDPLVRSRKRAQENLTLEIGSKIIIIFRS